VKAKEMIPGYERNLVQPETRNIKCTDSYLGSKSPGLKESALSVRSNLKLTILRYE
jgi:hypothetical protein